MARVIVALFFFIGTACALSDPTGRDDILPPGGHGRCRPPAPVVANMNSAKSRAQVIYLDDSSWYLIAQFSGVWYVDSTTLSGWGRATCHAYQFKWNDGEFIHHNRTYPGFFTYFLRIDYSSGNQGCWKGCTFSRQGYLHGWITGADYSRCNFGEVYTNDTTLQQSDPCHPHYQSKWDIWLLNTNYKTYGVVWLCSGDHPYAMLLSRSKQGLSNQQRQAAEAYLRHYGVRSRFYTANNQKC